MSTFTNNNVASGDVVRASDHNTQGASIAAVVNGNIEADNLASNAVTTAKIADGAVTNAKLSTTSGELGGAWQTWVPSYSASGSMTYTSVTTTKARYMLVGKTFIYELRASGTTGGTASSTITFTLPVTLQSNDSQSCGSSIVTDGATISGVSFPGSTTSVSIRRGDASNFGLGTGRNIAVSGTLETA